MSSHSRSAGKRIYNSLEGLGVVAIRDPLLLTAGGVAIGEGRDVPPADPGAGRVLGPAAGRGVVPEREKTDITARGEVGG
jgi:hypothetical protein